MPPLPPHPEWGVRVAFPACHSIWLAKPGIFSILVTPAGVGLVQLFRPPPDQKVGVEGEGTARLPIWQEKHAILGCLVTLMGGGG